MAQQNHRTRHPLTWAVITILTIAPLVGTLWVPFYARVTPKLGDFPFFYWYLLLWVVIVGFTSAVAYALVRTTGRGGGKARVTARAGGGAGMGGPRSTGGTGSTGGSPGSGSAGPSGGQSTGTGTE
jgi:Protein of unknown function (DUF3311)